MLVFLAGQSVRQHRMVTCRITMVVRKMKTKAEQKTKWWKLEKGKVWNF